MSISLDAVTNHNTCNIVFYQYLYMYTYIRTVTIMNNCIICIQSNLLSK